MSSRSAPPVSELSLVSLASYLDTQQSAGYREGLADVADPRPRRGLGMRGRTYRTAVHSTHETSNVHANRVVPRDGGGIFEGGVRSVRATRAQERWAAGALECTGLRFGFWPARIASRRTAC